MSLENGKKIYDLVVLGGGPAGITAAIYGGRAGLDVLIVEQMLLGGEIASTHFIENYPGFPEGISGAEFGEKLEQHARRFGAEIISATVESVVIDKTPKMVVTSAGEFLGRTLLVATGTYSRSLGIEGEEKLLGRGISSCATCDGFFFRNKTVAVIGGGDEAVQEALFLTKLAAKVILIHRRNKLNAVKTLQDEILNNPKVEFIWDTVVREFHGEEKLRSITIENVKEQKVSELAVDGAFLYAGKKKVPNTGFLKGLEMDGQGYIITNEEMETSVPGVYAAGDIRRKFLRQVITAAADGAIAATMAYKYLKERA
ncbi:MAG: thioredoxin-disulfide reductase [Dethiobacteria bacterium]|jgi:thioredoxin reductase (NADPH)